MLPLECGVIADAAVAVELVGGGNCLGRSFAEQQAGAGEERAVDEIASGDRLVHAEPFILRALFRHQGRPKDIFWGVIMPSRRE